MAENNSVLQHINNKPLREQVSDMLRDAIVTGELKPGQQLVEVAFATQFGVSRAPLREAFQILSREGLVETVAYKGTIVRKLTRTDIEELYSLRSVLECFAVQRVVLRADPDDLARLRTCYDNMLAAAENGDLKSVNIIDRQFHDTLIELSRHKLLAMVWNVVSLRVRQVMALLNERNPDIRQIANNHLPIINAIAAGDVDLSVTLLQQHIASSGDLIAEDWTLPEGDGES